MGLGVQGLGLTQPVGGRRKARATLGLASETLRIYQPTFPLFPSEFSSLKLSPFTDSHGLHSFNQHV